MSCKLEFEGCTETSLVMFEVKKFGQKATVWCCLSCYRELCGPALERANQATAPKKPMVPSSRQSPPAATSLRRR